MSKVNVTIWSSGGAINAIGCIDWVSGIKLMKSRIVKNSLKVIEIMEEVEILPIWSNQVAKNVETKLWIRKGTLLPRR